MIKKIEVNGKIIDAIVEENFFPPEIIEELERIIKKEEEEKKEREKNYITYEEAFEIAKEDKEIIDSCVEYDIAYIFECKEDNLIIGGYGPIVVMKEDGKIVCLTEFFDDKNPQFIRQFDTEK